MVRALTVARPFQQSDLLCRGARGLERHDLLGQQDRFLFPSCYKRSWLCQAGVPILLQMSKSLIYANLVFAEGSGAGELGLVGFLPIGQK